MSMAFQNLPDPATGDGVTAEWGRAVARAIRSLRLSGGPGVRVSTTPSGTTVSVPGPGGRGGDGDGVRVPGSEGEPLPGDDDDAPYLKNVRLVVDWRYDPSYHRAEVLYGTLTLAGGVLSIVPDTDAGGAEVWSHAPGDGPYNGGGTQAEEESY